MTDLRAQKRMASDLLGRGKNGIWVDPEAIFKVSSAITREDVSKLIHDGIIKPKKVVGTSRGRARARRFKNKRGQGRGPGSRKGSKTARSKPKRNWINKINCCNSVCIYKEEFIWIFLS